MSLFIKKPAIAYGLDLDGDRVTVVRAMAGRSGIHTEVLCIGDPASGGLLASAAPKIEKEVRQGQAVTVTALPVRDCFTRRMQVPFRSRKKALQVLPSALDIQLPFPLDEAEYRFTSLRQNEQGTDVLAVSTRDRAIKNHLAAWRDAGIDPVLLDHQGLALWGETLRAVPPEDGSTRVLVWLGHSRGMLLMGDGGVLLSAHSLRLDTSPDQPFDPNALLQRCRQLIQHAPHNRCQWVWAGPGSMDSVLLDKLNLALQEQYSDQLTIRTLPDAETALSKALALRGLKSLSDLFDLHPQEERHALHVRLGRSGLNQAACTFMLCGLLMAGAGIVFGSLSNQKEKAMDRAIQGLAVELSGLPSVPAGQEVLVVERALAARPQQKSPFDQALQPPNGPLLQRILQTCSAAGLDLASYSVRPDTVTLNGTSPDWDRCELLEAALREAGYQTSLKREDAGADERVHFTLQGRVDYAG